MILQVFFFFNWQIAKGNTNITRHAKSEAMFVKSVIVCIYICDCK